MSKDKRKRIQMSEHLRKMDSARQEIHAKDEQIAKLSKRVKAAEDDLCLSWSRETDLRETYDVLDRKARREERLADALLALYVGN